MGIICYFLFGSDSLSAACRALPFIPSVSSLSRSVEKIPSNRLMRRLQKSILRKKNINPNDWIYVLDDTSNPKHAHLFRAGWWGSSGGVYFGQKIMVLILVNIKTHQAIPLDYHIVPKKKHDKSPKVNYYAQYLLRKALNCGFPKLDVVADSWFDGRAFMQTIERMGLNLIFQVRNNRKIKKNPGKYVRWESIKDAFKSIKKNRVKTDWDSKKVKRGFKRGKSISQAHVQIRNRGKSLKMIAVYDRKNSVNAFGFYASTDQSMSGSRIWMLSRARWSIEVIFRSLKQHLSFGKLSCRPKEATHLSVAMPFYLLYILSEKCPDSLEIPRYLGQIRENCFNETIDILTKNPQHPMVSKLRGRRRVDRAHRKPCDSVCGKGFYAA